MRPDTLDTVRACIAGVLSVDPECVAPEATLLDLGAQSLDFLGIVACIEATLGVGLARHFTLPVGYSVADLARAAADSLDPAARD